VQVDIEVHLQTNVSFGTRESIEGEPHPRREMMCTITITKLMLTGVLNGSKYTSVIGL
jgi:hypothetical protein